MNTRDTILQHIKAALQHSSPPSMSDELSNPVPKPGSIPTSRKKGDLVHQFQNELEKVSGECIFVKTSDEMITALLDYLQKFNYTQMMITPHPQIKSIADALSKKDGDLRVCETTEYSLEELSKIPVSLVDVDFAIADTGTLAVLLSEDRSSLPYILPECVIGVVKSNQFIVDNTNLLNRLDPSKAKQMMMITGPSRTADIEKTLVLGAHGPKRLAVFCMIK